MINGDYIAGSKELVRFARTLGPQSEGRAEHYLDAGLAAWCGGERAQAGRIWSEGAEFDGNAGNTPWLKLIRDALQLRA